MKGSAMPPLAMTTASPESTSNQAHAACCPICRGALVDMRGLSRCSRCQFILCQACDGEQAESLDGDFPEE
jgi:hypothetical protein